MLSAISENLAKRYVEKAEKDEEKIGLYSYAFFHMLSFAAFFSLAIILGIIFKILPQSVLFFISFWLIRIYAGGFHAKTETACAVLSTVGIMFFTVLIKLCSIYEFQSVLAMLAALSAVLIYFICPLDTPQKHLSEKELKYFRKILLVILLAICITIITALCLNVKILFIPLCCGLIFEGILIAAGKIECVYENKKSR